MSSYFDNLEPVQLSALFTRPNFKRLSESDDAAEVLRDVLGWQELSRFNGQTIAEIYDNAWMMIRKFYRNEYVYKNEVASRVVFGRHNPRTAGLHVELPVAGSIADLAIYNGTSTAYEIKTDLDSPARLATQSQSYLKAFDKVYVVVSEKNLYRYQSDLPKNVGLLALTKRGSLREVKKALSNSSSVEHLAMYQCLRKNEKIEVAEIISGQKIKLPNGLIYQHCLSLFEKVSVETAHHLYVEQMRARQTDTKIQAFVKSLPYSLRVLGYATPLSDKKRKDLTDKLAVVL
ncbi:sce7726 family protein [Halomonas sp. LY9]